MVQWTTQAIRLLLVGERENLCASNVPKNPSEKTKYKTSTAEIYFLNLEIFKIITFQLEGTERRYEGTKVRRYEGNIIVEMLSV